MTTTMRAAIMLSALVGLPAAWMYYGPLPDSAQRAVDRFVAAAKKATRWNAADFKPAPPRFDQGAPPFVPQIAVVAVAPNRSASPSTAAPLTLAAQLEPMLAQLRQLGVAAYDLEAWGAQQRLYRFTCEAPLGGSTGITEQFEAVAADPATSVEQVLAQVALRSGGYLAATR